MVGERRVERPTKNQGKQRVVGAMFLTGEECGVMWSAVEDGGEAERLRDPQLDGGGGPCSWAHTRRVWMKNPD